MAKSMPPSRAMMILFVMFLSIFSCSENQILSILGWMDYVKKKPEENDVPIRNPSGCSSANPGIYGNLSSVSDPNLLFFSFWGSFDPFRERHDPWGYATGKSQTLSEVTRFLLWWFRIFNFQPYLGKIPILANIFQMGWNHQLVFVNGFTIIQSPSLVDGKTWGKHDQHGIPSFASHGDISEWFVNLTYTNKCNTF